MSMSLRLVIVAMALCATLSMAASWKTCPSPDANKNYYSVDTTGCARTIGCASDLCTCQGNTYNATSNKCSKEASSVVCATTTKCIRDAIRCLNSASDNATCTALNALKLELLATQSAPVFPAYNSSSLEKACKSTACNMLNKTQPNDCDADINYGTMCMSPFARFWEARLGGNFSAFFHNATLLKQLKAALESDLYNKLLRQMVVYYMAEGSLIFQFYADPAGLTSASLDTLASSVTQLASSTSWLTSVAALGSQNGVGTITISAITTINTGTNAPVSTPAPSDEACGAGCIAGVVIAAVVVVIIIVIVVIFVTRKPAEGDGQKATEPINNNDNQREMARV